ncbi:hypothetical protein Ancab_001743, partial [Ancistrocladus abbreviatus]
GRAQCTDNDLKLNQIGTGKDVEGKPQWMVTLINGCNCAFSHVILSCRGFHTVEKIKCFILSKSGDECIINYSNAIAPHSSFSFTYAWEDPFPFTVKFAELSCS